MTRAQSNRLRATTSVDRQAAMDTRIRHLQKSMNKEKIQREKEIENRERTKLKKQNEREEARLYWIKRK